jgi:hypothetical protein
VGLLWACSFILLINDSEMRRELTRQRVSADSG